MGAEREHLWKGKLIQWSTLEACLAHPSKSEGPRWQRLSGGAAGRRRRGSWGPQLHRGKRQGQSLHGESTGWVRFQQTPSSSLQGRKLLTQERRQKWLKEAVVRLWIRPASRTIRTRRQTGRVWRWRVIKEDTKGLSSCKNRAVAQLHRETKHWELQFALRR